MNKNFIPAQAVIRNISKENEQISSFSLELTDKTLPFTFLPGQFLMLSVPHCGEAAISISSSPDTLPLITLSIRRAGELTEAVHRMKTGDTVGLRGPFGKPFPIETFTHYNLLFVAGGIGLAPLKSVIDHCLFQCTLEEDTVGSISLLYGSRTPSDIAFKQVITSWQEQGVDCRLTVDEKVDNFFSTLSDWQLGQFTFGSEPITSSSNSSPHPAQIYSNIGIFYILCFFTIN